MKARNSFIESILGAVKNCFVEKEGVKHYKKLLTYFLRDGVIAEEEMKQLEYIEQKYDLSKPEVKKLLISILSQNFKSIIADHKISEAERISLEKLLNQFEISTKEIYFDQNLFNKYYALGLIEEGSLPKIDSNHHNINLIFKKGEVLHFGAEAAVRKLCSVTKRVRYGGLSCSIRIMKGVRYRLGSVGFQAVKQEILKTEDSGVFYITSQRIGFIGNRKQFSIPFNKLVSLDLTAEGLFIFKSGKETPYIIALNDYEVALAMISFILNKNT
ncbi:TPA: hypothetical protein ACULYW_001747 [Legionella pneumophila]